MRTPLIIDCDPGLDDAIALFLAFASPELEILAVTTVAGNVSAALTARNARFIRQLARREEVPVYAGCSVPLVRPPVEAAYFHGESGLGSIAVHEPDSPLAQGHAVEAIIGLVMDRPPESVTMAVTGPMTNLATAMAREPELAGRLGKVAIMGGALPEGAGGNITPYAEFNIFADPHAAQAVFSSGIEAVVFGLDATHQVRATAARTAGLGALRTPAGQTTAQLLDFANETERRLTGSEGAPLHDPCTIAWLLDPSLFETQACSIAVETESPVKLGCTKVDFQSPEGTCRWVTRADADGVFALLTERLAR